ncbi:hypothetical protein [Parasphingorhabdus sp.]|uniref:hypothetical protein n=1 Tax=Parasphingorhabdus sp. TaxID=2709688 RepID=UPI002B26D462|nr:hypothetical protein [Parasphingorhabdus sp.]
MQRALRSFGIVFPIGYLIAISIMLENMFPGWASYYFSLKEQSIGERLFLIPIIVFIFVAWKSPRQWLPYLLIVELLIFVPTIFQVIRMLGRDHAHPWLGLAGLYQLVWMLGALVVGFLGRWIWRTFNKQGL